MIKIKLNYLDEIKIYLNEYNTINFTNTKDINRFYELINLFLKNRKTDEIYITDEYYKDINKKEYNFIYIPPLFDKDIKEYKKILEELVTEYIEHNQQILNNYINITEDINNILDSIVLNNKYKLKYNPNNININNILKMVDYDLTIENENLNLYELKKAYIEFTIRNNTDNIIIVLFPEIGIGTKDFLNFSNYLRTLKDTTVIVVSNELIFLSNVEGYKNINIFDSTSSLCDTEILYKSIEQDYLLDDKEILKLVVFILLNQNKNDDMFYNHIASEYIIN